MWRNNSKTVWEAYAAYSKQQIRGEAPLGRAPCAALALLACVPMRAARRADAGSEATGGPLQEVIVNRHAPRRKSQQGTISVTALTQEASTIAVSRIFGGGALHAGSELRQLRHEQYLYPRYLRNRRAGTTGIYLDDTPIQMRALAFNPMSTAQVLRHRSCGGAARTAGHAVRRRLRGRHGALHHHAASLTRPAFTAARVFLQPGRGSELRSGRCRGGPLVQDKFGARLSVWYRKDAAGSTASTRDARDRRQEANHDETVLVRLAGCGRLGALSVTPSIYYQDRSRNDISRIGRCTRIRALTASSARTLAALIARQFYLPSLKIEGDIGAAG